uniref:Serpentine receptor class gamma n=1 Tax=Haemonchus contortus TaxID=6289 RepID=A0A7I4YU42_HAECO
MDDFNCSIPTPPLIGSTRIFYVATCIVTIIVSIALQTVFAITCQKLKGWKSDFAFYLLQLMAIWSLLSYIGILVSYVHGLLLFDSHKLPRVAGSNYEGSFIAFITTNLCLTVHRLLYTLLPLRSQFILTAAVGRICIASIVLFYIVYMAVTLSPLASVKFCAALFYFYAGQAPLQNIISLMDRLLCYAAGIVNVTAYTIMFATLFIRGSLTFKRNREVQMTIQTALTSAFELTLFICSADLVKVLPDYWSVILRHYLFLIYYDVLLLPYLILNETVKAEMKKFYRKRGSTTPTLVRIDRFKIAPRGRQSIWSNP